MKAASVTLKIIACLASAVMALAGIWVCTAGTLFSLGIRGSESAINIFIVGGILFLSALCTFIPNKKLASKALYSIGYLLLSITTATILTKWILQEIAGANYDGAELALARFAISLCFCGPLSLLIYYFVPAQEKLSD